MRQGTSQPINIACPLMHSEERCDGPRVSHPNTFAKSSSPGHGDFLSGHTSLQETVGGRGFPLGIALFFFHHDVCRIGEILLSTG